MPRVSFHPSKHVEMYRLGIFSVDRRWSPKFYPVCQKKFQIERGVKRTCSRTPCFCARPSLIGLRSPTSAEGASEGKWRGLTLRSQQNAQSCPKIPKTSPLRYHVVQAHPGTIVRGTSSPPKAIARE